MLRPYTRAFVILVTNGELTITRPEFSESFDPAPNQTFTFTWDGLNAFGRSLYGTQTALVQQGNGRPIGNW